MLTKYIEALMDMSKYEMLPDGSFYGHIDGIDGVSARAGTQEACRNALEEDLEDWVLVRFSNHEPLPAIDGIELASGEFTCYLPLFDVEEA